MTLEDKHWTDKDELIERFVLNRLNPEERNELEDHLRICEVCKQAVRAEQVLVAGIRRSGREQFKGELSKKLVSLPEKKTPWGQILSAAAVIVILLTIGIYNRWFEGQLPQPSLTPIIPSQPSQSTQSEDKTSSVIAQQSPTPEGVASKSPQQTERQMANEARRRKESTEESAPLKSVGLAGDIVTQAAPTYAEQGKDRDDSQPAISGREAMLLSDVQGSFWIEGMVLSGTDDTKNENAIVRQGQQETETNRLKKTDAQPHAGYAARADIHLKQTVANSSIALSQQNSVALPPTQQRLQRRNNTGTLMTKVDRIGNKTQLTLFLDSLIDDNELKKATFETPGDDSLILNLSNQRIGYKLPQGWNAKPVK